MNAQAIPSSQLSALNSNATVKTYLKALVENNPSIELAYENILFTAQLNYSMGSLQRVDHLLTQLKNNSSPDFTDYKDNPKKHNFLLVLAFYIGEMAAKYKKTSVNWYTPEQFSAVFQDEPKLSQTLANHYVAIINQQMFKPIEFVLQAIFRKENSNLTQFLKRHLNKKGVKLTPTIEMPILQDEQLSQSKEHRPVIQNSSLNSPFTHSTQTDTVVKKEQTKTLFDQPTSHISHNQPDDVMPAEPTRTADTHVISQHNMLDSQEELPVADTALAHLAVNAETAIEAQTRETQHPAFLPEADNEAHNNETLMVRTTQHASKLIRQFKPPVLPAILWSLPCMALLSYALYSAIVTDTGFSTGNIITLVLFGAALIAIWVNYAMSNVSVFNNKVTANSLIKNKAAIFDNSLHEMRFYHIPASNSALGKLFEPASAKILTSQDTLSVSAQNHDELEDVLLELETELLYESILAKLQNNETVIFGEIQLTKDLLVYGKKGLAVNRVGDYDITGNDFVILDTNGQTFARIALATQPNINTLVSVIEELQG